MSNYTIKFAAWGGLAATPFLIYITLYQYLLLITYHRPDSPRYGESQDFLEIVTGALAISMAWALCLMLVGLITGLVIRGRSEVGLKITRRRFVLVWTASIYLLLFLLSLGFVYLARDFGCSLGDVRCKPFWSDISLDGAMMFLAFTLGGALSGSVMGMAFFRLYSDLARRQNKQPGNEADLATKSPPDML